MDMTWMYRARRTDAYFHGEHNKFIQAGKNHERNKKTRWISCPCKPCKNPRVFNDTTTIRLHVLVRFCLGLHDLDVSWRECSPSDG